MHFAPAHDGLISGANLGNPLRGFYVPHLPENLRDTLVYGRNAGASYVVKVKQGSFADITSAYRQVIKQIASQSGPAERWKRLVLNPNASSDVDSLTETAESAMDCITEFGPKALDLSGLAPECVNCEHLATLLRVTSTWQNEISGWHDALAVAKQACNLANTDPEDVLFGMI
jgi:hypothetical protein